MRHGRGQFKTFVAGGTRREESWGDALDVWAGGGLISPGMPLLMTRLSRLSMALIGGVVAGCFFLLYQQLLAPSQERPRIDRGSPARDAQPARSDRAPNAAPLRIGYSDWPGWVAWDVGVQKGWFRAAGIPVEFVWYEYVQTLEAFAAGRVDGCSMTNGDQLVTGANGAPSVAILLNDYSNGNDMLVARSGIDRVQELRGRKVGVELGFVSHLLLLKALESAHLVEGDVTLFNVATEQTPQALEAGNVDAIVAWQPSSGRALREVPGSKAIFTSADVPGLIYDVLAVNPESLRLRRTDWETIVSIWFDIVDYIRKPENRQEVLAIMSRRVGVAPEAFALLLDGVFLLGADDNVKHFGAGDTLASVYHSSRVVDAFNLANRVYKVSPNPDAYLQRDLVDAIVPRR